MLIQGIYPSGFPGKILMGQTQQQSRVRYWGWCFVRRSKLTRNCSRPGREERAKVKFNLLHYITCIFVTLKRLHYFISCYWWYCNLWVSLWPWNVSPILPLYQTLVYRRVVCANRTCQNPWHDSWQEINIFAVAAGSLKKYVRKKAWNGWVLLIIIFPGMEGTINTVL